MSVGNGLKCTPACSHVCSNGFVAVTSGAVRRPCRARPVCVGAAGGAVADTRHCRGAAASGGGPDGRRRERARAAQT
eukprot:3537004-Pleurochrysis_carterae.AAC.3